jgi:hypothetical protein
MIRCGIRCAATHTHIPAFLLPAGAPALSSPAFCCHRSHTHSVNGSGARLYLHPDSFERILREKVERELYAAALERRKHEEAVAEREEQLLRAKVAAERGEEAAAQWWVQHRKQKLLMTGGGGGGGGGASVQVMGDEEEAKDAAAATAALGNSLALAAAVSRQSTAASAAAADSSAPLVGAMTPEELQALNSSATSVIRHKPVTAGEGAQKVLVWLHVCRHYNEPHTRDSWPCQGDGRCCAALCCAALCCAAVLLCCCAPVGVGCDVL